jgi:hypothetical protein
MKTAERQSTSYPASDRPTPLTVVHDHNFWAFPQLLVLR